MSETIVDAYWKLPAIARTVTTAAFTLSISIVLHIVRGDLWIHHPLYLWQLPPQIWRPVTNFLLLGEGLPLLFNTYFLYHYMSQLENGHPRFPRKADLIWYLMFVCTTVLVINWAVDLPFYSFIDALILAMAYTVTQDQRGMKATFFFFTIPAQLIPTAMILVNLLFPGGYLHMLIQIEGLVAAHLYDFLSRLWPEFGGGPNIIATPAFVSRLVRTPRVLQRGFGTAIRPQEPETGSSTGASRGPLPDAWKTRGRGQRLG